MRSCECSNENTVWEITDNLSNDERFPSHAELNLGIEGLIG